jgi:polyisoprenyl-teichoic acid--peptidoglycan teichoic acid transferase
LIAVNVVTLLAIIGVGGAYGYAQWRLGQIKRVAVPNVKPVGKTAQSQCNGCSIPPFTMLVIGSDSRNLGAGGSAAFGSDTSVEGQRSDSIILVRVVPKTKSLAILSIPRDTIEPIPGYGTTRINTAFNTGSPSLLVTVLSQDFGIDVNHVAIFNFDTFRAVADAVGGVEQYFPTPAKDDFSLLSIPAAGCYNLTGDQALAFVRARHYEYYQNGEWHYEAESDLARIQRQQAFIKKMIVKSESQLTNPIAINDVVGAVVKNLTVDSGFSTSLLLELAKDFHSVDAATVPSLTLPNYPYTTAGGAAVLGLQQPQANQAIAAFNSFGNTPPPRPVKKTTTKKPAPTTTTTVTTPPVTVANSSVNVEVANGTGIAGQAGQLSQALQALHYNATVNQNSPGSTYAKTTIQYAPDSLTAARQLAAEIPGGATLVESAALTPTTFNVQVITGASYTVAGGHGSGAASGSTTSTSSTTTATTVPGTNSGVYELPGSTGPPPANC